MAEETKFNDVNEMVTESSDTLSNSIMTDNNNRVCDSVGKTFFSETVLASRDCIARLPDTILNLIHDYDNGLLPPTTKEEVNQLLSAWFNNEPISEQSTLPGESISGQSSSQFLKRRRVSGNV